MDEVNLKDEIDRLHKLASDAHDQGQYQIMCNFLTKTSDMALRLEDIKLLIRERYSLAEGYRHLGKMKASLEISEWLISLPRNPELWKHEIDDAEISLLINAHADFVASGLTLQHGTISDYQKVLDAGFQLVDDLGKPRTWTAELHRVKGALHLLQLATDSATKEFETALALRKQSPTQICSTTLIDFQIGLAMALISSGKFLEAITFLESALAEPNIFEERRAIAEIYLGLAYSTSERFDEGAKVAQKAIDRLEHLQNPNATFLAYFIYISNLVEINIDLAYKQAIKLYWQGKKIKDVDSLITLMNISSMLFSLVRYEQARVIMPNLKGRKYLEQAKRFLHKGSAIFQELDRKTGSSIYSFSFLKPFEEDLKGSIEFYEELYKNRGRWITRLAIQSLGDKIKKVIDSIFRKAG
jgi:tetratricopeptide (TPR) repeat protein